MRATVPVPRPDPRATARAHFWRETLIERGLLVPYIPLEQRPTLRQDSIGRTLAANVIYLDGLAPVVMLNPDADPEVRAHCEHLCWKQPAAELLAQPWTLETLFAPEPEAVAA